MIDFIFIALGVLSGFAIGVPFGRNPKVKHDHIWNAVSSRHSNIYSPGGERPTHRRTQILKVCFCGDNKVQEVEGNWDFEDLTKHTI